MRRPTVILRDCPEYDVERIRGIVRDGLDTLKLTPKGRALVKPNLVASGEMFPHAYTRPEFMEGVLLALQDRAQGVTELAIGERCGITVPTRYAYKNAGYDALSQKLGVPLYAFEESQQVEIPLYHPERLRDSLFTPEPVARADFFVNCPKFKAHPWTTVTFSMKNYIGIQDDRHRLLDHDHHLSQKVADLQYVLQPQFIAIDGVVAGEGRMLTPLPFALGLVVMGDNQVAVDAVCSRLIGVDPMEVDHIRLAHERGFGPVSLDDITLEGDVTLDQAQARAQAFRVGLVRVEDYFQDTNIRAYGGPPPGGKVDYCWGGCPGALEEAIEILRVFDKATDAKVPKVHLVFGRQTKPIDAAPGEKVVFIGDCAEYHGDLFGQRLDVDSRYVDRSRRSPLTAREDDIFVKMARTTANMVQHRKDDVVFLGGCPVSVAEQVLALVHLGSLKNPYLDPRVSLDFVSCYLSTKTRKAIARMRGVPYNQPGPVRRGEARPPQNRPPAGTAAPLER